MYYSLALRLPSLFNTQEKRVSLASNIMCVTLEVQGCPRVFKWEASALYLPEPDYTRKTMAAID